MRSTLKKHIKKTLCSLKRNFRFYNSTRAFQKRYKHIASGLFSRTLEDEIIRKYRGKWSILGKKVEVNTFLLCYNLSGKIDYNIVPENLFAAMIEKELNPYKELSFFSVKNIYEKWFEDKSVFPKSYFHKIDDIYYDESFRIIENRDTFFSNKTFKYPLILKCSKDTSGGSGVRIIRSYKDLMTSIGEFRYFVCQELIVQNKDLDLINDSSINSIRTCLYRTRTGYFKVLNNSIRFGINGGLDNETSGGIICNIEESGKLNNYAVSKYAVKYFKHPNSDVEFSKIKIPFFEKLNVVAENIANQIPFCNLVSLDMCLDCNNNWRCIEINLKAQTIRFAQYAGIGFFGKYTDEVIDKLLNNEDSHTS